MGSDRDIKTLWLSMNVGRVARNSVFFSIIFIYIFIIIFLVKLKRGLDGLCRGKRKIRRREKVKVN